MGKVRRKLPAGATRVAVGGRIRNQAEAKAFIETGLWLAGAEILRAENAKEYRKGNIASGVTVNRLRGGRVRETLSAPESKQLGKAPAGSLVLGRFRTAEVRYATKTSVKNAAVFVWRSLRSAMPKSRLGFASMYFWVRNRNQTLGEFKTVSQMIANTKKYDANGINYSINVVGPTVPWRRKMIYADSTRASLNKTDLNALTRRSGGKAPYKATKFLASVGPSRLVGYKPSAKIFENYRASLETRTTKAGRKITAYRVKKAVQHLVVKRAKKKYPQVAIGYYSKPAHEPTAADARGKRWPNDAKDPYIKGDGYVPSVYVTGAVRI